MGCNCGDNEYNISIDNNGSCEPTTPIYNIALGNVGVDGFSPSINIINQTLSSFQLEVTDINGRTVTDPIPISNYVETTFAKLASANIFTANNTFNGLTYFNGTMYTDKVYSKTTTTPLIIGGNSSTITLGANTTTVNYHGYEIVNSNDLSTTLADYSTSAEIASTYFTQADAANKLDKDGSNADNPISINGHTFQSLYGGLNTKLTMTGSPAYIMAPSIILASTDTGKVYYKTSSPYNELATLSDIPSVGNGTITLTQGGVLKGTFTTNQSGNATIDLDAGGGSSYTAGTGIDITNDTISIDTSVVAQLSDIPDVSDFVDTTTLTNTLSDYVETTTLTSTLSNYVETTTLATVATTGSYNNLTDKPTIPIVNNPTITFTQGGVSKGSITLNQSSNQTIALDAGGGGGVTNPISLTETVGTDVNTLELGIETDNGNPVLNFERVVDANGFSYTLNYNLLRYATAKSNSGLKDNWTTDYIGCSQNQLEVKVDNDTIKINGSGELYVDVSSSDIIDADTLNYAMKNKEDAFDAIQSPLAVTYTNGLFNPLVSTLSSDGILSGTNDWNSIDISGISINELTDYYKIVFLINRSTTIGSAVQVFCLEDANSEIFYLEVDSTALYVSDLVTQYESIELPTDQFVTVEIEHEANSPNISLSCNGTTINSITIRALTSDDISLISFAPVDNDIVLDISNKTYYQIMPNGEHHTFLVRSLVSESKFVYSETDLLSGAIINANSYKDCDVSTYLPDDNETYLVLVRVNGRSGTSSGNLVNLCVSSDVCTTWVSTCGAITRTNSYGFASSNTWIPVGSGRRITISQNSASAAASNVGATLFGYIKIAS